MTRRRSTTADLVVEGVAAYRLTRLVAADGITEPIRDAITRRACDVEEQEDDGERITHYARTPGPAGWRFLDDMVQCRWCAGMWCAFAVLILRRLPGGRWLRDALALGAAAALLARLEDD